MSVDAINDFALLCLGVWGDGEPWAHRGMNGLGVWCERRGGVDGFGMGRMGRGRGWIHECDGGGTELRLGGDDFDAAAEDVDGRRHVAVVWKCW